MSIHDQKQRLRKKFAKYIKGIRTSITTPYDLKANGILERNINNIEHGTANYTIDTLFKYLNHCGLSIFFHEGSWDRGASNKLELGQYLTSIRKKKEFNRNYLVKKGIKIDNINSIERATKEYTIDSLLLYCKALGIEIKLIS